MLMLVLDSAPYNGFADGYQMHMHVNFAKLSGAAQTITPPLRWLNTCAMLFVVESFREPIEAHADVEGRHVRRGSAHPPRYSTGLVVKGQVEIPCAGRLILELPFVLLASGLGERFRFIIRTWPHYLNG